MHIMRLRIEQQRGGDDKDDVLVVAAVVPVAAVGGTSCLWLGLLFLLKPLLLLLLLLFLGVDDRGRWRRLSWCLRSPLLLPEVTLLGDWTRSGADPREIEEAVSTTSDGILLCSVVRFYGMMYCLKHMLTAHEQIQP
jgi:hypothetical protein